MRNRFFVALAILTCLWGCAPSVVVERPVSVGAPGTEVGLVGPTLSKEYVIQPGDKLDIKFFYNPEMSDFMTVRPDGRISLQLVGEIVAAGRTPMALKAILTEKYEEELKSPEITVIVRSFGSRIYIDGEVKKPGEQELIGPLTVLQAISRAEGLTEKAWQEALVIRRIQGQEPLVIAVDLNDVLTGKDFTQDIGLVPFDVVYVPRSPVADVNLWVDQYIRKNIPINFGAFFPLN
ncbi:MAG: polysaccharide biosynthesis/export family protein [Nitrospira sp.]|nr:polysaccharide biosynthesis/export family protein [Nitrospira sp.]